jgi:UrcA family protein
MLYPHDKHSGTASKRATLMIIAACMTSLGLGGVSAMLPAPANAATQSDFRVKLVHYHDLDLGSKDGRERLHLRIRRAAKQVCSAQGVASVIQNRKVRECTEAAHDRAWASAQQRINKHRLAVRIPE